MAKTTFRVVRRLKCRTSARTCASESIPFKPTTSGPTSLAQLTQPQPWHALPRELVSSKSFHRSSIVIIIIINYLFKSLTYTCTFYNGNDERKKGDVNIQCLPMIVPLLGVEPWTTSTVVICAIGCATSTYKIRKTFTSLI